MLRTLTTTALRLIRLAGRIIDISFIALRRLLAIGALAAIVLYLVRAAPPLPPAFVVTLDLTAPIHDTSPAADTLGTALGHTPSLAAIVQRIHGASEDPRVQGIRLTLGPSCCSLVVANELHRALIAYRQATGKEVEAFAYGFGESDGGSAEYLIASAANRITLLDVGSFSASGIHMQVPFVRPALDRLGIGADYTHAGTYKSYPETFTRSGPSAPHAEMLGSLADSLYQTIIQTVAADRHLPDAVISDAFAAAPLGAPEALARHLVDARSADPPAEKPGETISIAAYPGLPDKRHGKPARIALIVATGTITDPTSDGRGTETINPIHLANLLRTAAADKETVAIVLRIDSPGGSASGAALVDAAIRNIVATKPVIVSMGGYAASGGYWIASHASRIVADPCTLTGSIGAFAGKIQFAELANRLGISFYEVDRGAPSMWSMTEGLTDTQQQRLGTSIDAIYRSFVQAVADGRHLKPEAVEAAAEGRVWTGAQARDLHLVDALGGYTEAIDAARQLAGLPADTAIALSFPRTTSILQELQTLTALMRTSFAPDLANAAAAWLDELHALANAGTVEMLPIHIH